MKKLLTIIRSQSLLIWIGLFITFAGLWLKLAGWMYNQNGDPVEEAGKTQGLWMISIIVLAVLASVLFSKKKEAEEQKEE